jgi:hypothetical protein
MRMADTSANIRQAVLEHVALVASARAQIEYERSVPVADVPAELICGFVDDLYHPKSQALLDAFTEAQLRDLAELYGRLCVAREAFERVDAHTVDAILKLPEWRSTVAFARDLSVRLRRDT